MPSSAKTITVTMRMPLNLSKTLDRWAKKEGRSKSNLIIRLLVEKILSTPH